jgi:hypothetical protein
LIAGHGDRGNPQACRHAQLIEHVSIVDVRQRNREDAIGDGQRQNVEPERQGARDACYGLRGRCWESRRRIASGAGRVIAIRSFTRLRIRDASHLTGNAFMRLR